MIKTIVLITGLLCSLLNAQADGDAYIWHDAATLHLEGKGWAATPSVYDRLPASAENRVTADVWHLSHHTAGLSVTFSTDADSVRVRWTLLSENLGLKNMPPTGVSGIDLYVREGDVWVFNGNGRPGGLSNEKTFFLAGAGLRTYKIYFPLYNGLTEMSIGIPRGSSFMQPPAVPSSKALVFYGTSITQGGCASRPGNAATSIVGRALGRPVINLGFSGAGKMEPVMAELLAGLNPSVYILDCLWNMTGEMVASRVEPFVRSLRTQKPDIPIVLVEDSNYLNDSPTARGEVLRGIYNKLIAEGMGNLYFLSNANMLGSDGEGTVDSVHPNDLGMWRQARVFTAFLKSLLEERKP